MKKVTSLINRIFIPEKVLNDEILYRKFLFLVVIHLLSLSMGTVLLICDKIFEFRLYNHVGYYMPLCIPLLYILKKRGSIILSANLFVLVLAAMFAFDMFWRGGFYTDIHWWFLCSPIIALFYANKKSGLIWFFVVAIYSTFIYVYSRYHPGFNFHNFYWNDEYYLLSSYLFNLQIFGLSFLAYLTQEHVVSRLKLQNERLAFTQKRLQFANDQLEYLIKKRTQQLDVTQKIFNSIIKNVNSTIIETDTSGNIQMVMDNIFDTQSLPLNLSPFGKNILETFKDAIEYDFLDDLTTKKKSITFVTDLRVNELNKKVKVTSFALEDSSNDKVIHFLLDLSDTEKD